MIGSYDTPQAFRAALEARLINIAQELGLSALTLHAAHAHLDAYWRRWGLGQVEEADH